MFSSNSIKCKNIINIFFLSSYYKLILNNIVSKTVKIEEDPKFERYLRIVFTGIYIQMSYLFALDKTKLSERAV